VAFIGVLLLAVGLGVLIGHSGKSPAAPKAAASPQVITVNGGGGASTGAAVTTATTPSTSGSNSNSGNGVHASKKTVAKEKAALANKAVQKKAVQAAGKVLGSGNNLAPPTVKTGGSCSNNQAGCQGGKFTGNFFGGG
jgi:hypothetical protein